MEVSRTRSVSAVAAVLLKHALGKLCFKRQTNATPPFAAPPPPPRPPPRLPIGPPFIGTAPTRHATYNTCRRDVSRSDSMKPCDSE